MPQSSRQRGKLVRKLIKFALEANRTEHSATVAANLSSKPKPLTQAERLARAVGPARYDAKPASTSRERLKGGSYGVGFQGPRGYGTPKGLVGKEEGNGQKLVSQAARPTPQAGKQRFAGDGLTKPDVAVSGTIQRKALSEKRWKTVG